MNIPVHYAAESPSHNALFRWRLERDLQPLIDLLKDGGADSEAQKLASELLTQARQRKLAYKPQWRMRKAAMLSYWAMMRSRGKSSTAAQQAVAEMFGTITPDAVEKLITRNPDFVAQLKAELKFD